MRIISTFRLTVIIVLCCLSTILAHAQVKNSLQETDEYVTISGKVTDFSGNPINHCTVAWKSPNFYDIEGATAVSDANGLYKARIRKGKYLSMSAIDCDVYPHTAKADVARKDLRLEYWAWDFIADRDTTIDIRYDKMEVYGVRIFAVPGGMPTFNIYVRPMSLSRFFKNEEEAKYHGEDVSNITQDQLSSEAKEARLAPTADKLKATVWINGEEVNLLMKQEVKEYYSATEYGNAYILTVDRPKNKITLPYLVFKIELEDLENGDRGEALCYLDRILYQN